MGEALFPGLGAAQVGGPSAGGPCLALQAGFVPEQESLHHSRQRDPKWQAPLCT